MPIFHGETVDFRDVITFRGRSVEQRKQALAECVEDCPAFCETRGEEPEKPYSGQFVVRVEPGLHRAAVRAARRAGVGLDRWVAGKLERATT